MYNGAFRAGAPSSQPTTFRGWGNLRGAGRGGGGGRRRLCTAPPGGHLLCANNRATVTTVQHPAAASSALQHNRVAHVAHHHTVSREYQWVSWKCSSCHFPVPHPLQFLPLSITIVLTHSRAHCCCTALLLPGVRLASTQMISTPHRPLLGLIFAVALLAARCGHAESN